MAKGIFASAMTHFYQSQNRQRRLLAIICFDFTVEIILKTIIASLNGRMNQGDKFKQLCNIANNLLLDSHAAGLPEQNGINKVHSIRNAAQHEARYPTIYELNDCRTHVADFLSEACQLVWGIDFFRLSLSDLIEHVEIKNYIVKAESCLADNNYSEAVIEASAGFYKTLSFVRPKIYSNRKLTFGRTKDAIQQRIIRIEEALNYVANVVVITALGIDYGLYKKYISKAPLIEFALAGNYFVKWGRRNNNPQREDAEFVVNFCVEAIIQIESKAGDINNPFDTIVDV